MSYEHNIYMVSWLHNMITLLQTWPSLLPSSRMWRDCMGYYPQSLCCLDMINNVLSISAYSQVCIIVLSDKISFNVHDVWSSCSRQSACSHLLQLYQSNLALVNFNSCPLVTLLPVCRWCSRSQGCAQGYSSSCGGAITSRHEAYSAAWRCISGSHW